MHIPVMKEEVVQYLRPIHKASLMIDGTLGEGGHAEQFLEGFPELRVIGVDTDDEMIDRAKKRLSRFGDRMEYANMWFDDFFREYGNRVKPHRILLDLGVSLYHFEEAGRGFSFQREEELDMRLNRDTPTTAKTIISNYSEQDLRDLFFHLGEERFSRRIAKAIVKKRNQKAITTTKELAEIVWSAVPQNARYKRLHPATRVFQALRIKVNDELQRLKMGLEEACSILPIGGRIGVLAFHSLEDRIVKHFFRSLNNDSISSEYTPKYKYGDQLEVTILTKKPLYPTDEEKKSNPPSRSARFRVLEIGKRNRKKNAE